MVMPESERQSLAQGRHADPFAVLGVRQWGEAWWAHAFMPSVSSVDMVDAHDGRCIASLQRSGHSDVFAAPLTADQAAVAYRWRVVHSPGQPAVLVDDAYRFAPLLGDTDVWLLAEGKHRQPMACLGAHPRCIDGVQGTAFAVWAPNAQRVSVVGDFNAWDGRCLPMRLRRECGVWELFVPGVGEGALYKFEVLGCDDVLRLKADPYALRAQLRPETASVVASLPPARPMSPARAQANALDQPLSIYEVHLGSWRKQEGWRWLSYRELADTLVPYVQGMGFTHLELLPISEHPFDGSWGYQPLGLFAPTSRFGSPEDFAYFVDAAHAAGLGVILDWVPAHFPSDDHGLAQFDGTHLYEHADPKEGYHQDWNTLIYNFGRREVRSFLIGNALYWLQRFGIDGLRVDAVASMLYRDYSRAEGEWVPNQYGGRENLEAIAFLRELNHAVGTTCAGALMIAEESTSFPGVSRPPSDDLQAGGLGFHYKWNMGWMHDTLGYFGRESVHRRHHQQDLTFGLMYAFSENFVLPLSHDEVVHGKGSLLARMPGDAWQRMANLRAMYAFMWAYPGKKLLFMGCELAQPSEWAADGALPWTLEQEAPHAGVQRLVRDLNRVYAYHAPLHQRDVDPDGFAWIAHDDAEQSVVAWSRSDAQGRHVVVVCNFTPVPRKDYRLGVPVAGAWTELLNTDAAVYGGSGVTTGVGHTEALSAHGHGQSLRLQLPPLACVLLMCDAE